MNDQEAKNLTDDQVWEHIQDCIATLKVLRDNGSAKYDQIQAQFLDDVKLLHTLGRIDEDTYNELNDEAILRFT